MLTGRNQHSGAADRKGGGDSLMSWQINSSVVNFKWKRHSGHLQCIVLSEIVRVVLYAGAKPFNPHSQDVFRKKFDSSQPHILYMIFIF